IDWTGASPTPETGHEDQGRELTATRGAVSARRWSTETSLLDNPAPVSYTISRPNARGAPGSYNFGMPQTLYEKLWNSHLVREESDGTGLIYIDRHLVHEVTSPQAFE